MHEFMYALNGAMSEEDAARAESLLKNGRFLKVDASHVINLDKPELFTKLLRSFCSQDAADI